MEGPKVLRFPTARERYNKSVDECIRSLDPILVALGRKYDDPLVVVAAVMQLLGGMLREMRIKFGLKSALRCYRKIGRLMLLD